jgi:hypothetical protein
MVRTRPALLATAFSVGLAVACALDDRSLIVHPALTPAGGTSNGMGGASSSGGSSSGGASGGSSAGKANSGGSVSQSGSDAGGSGSGGDISKAGSSGSESGSSGAGGTPSSGGSAGSAGTAGSSGAGNVGLPYYEDFEDSLAQGWISGVDGDGATVFSEWPILNLGTYHAYEAGVEADTNWAVGGDLQWTDQWVEVDVRFTEMPAGASSAVLYLAARFQSFDRYYFVELRGTGALKLRKRVDGSTTDLGTTTIVLPAVGGWFRLAVIAQGNDLTVRDGGTLVISAVDGALGSGGIALGAVEARVQFDMVSVTDPSP